jgi:hypothetical protein
MKNNRKAAAFFYLGTGGKRAKGEPRGAWREAQKR